MTRAARGRHAVERAAPPVETKLAGKSKLTGTVIAELPLWQQFGRIGGPGMTPARVSQVLQSADLGQIASFVDLMHEAREKDLHLHSVLSTFEADLSGVEWRVLPATGTKNPRKGETKLATVYQAAIDECQGFQDMLAHEAGESELFGHATSEVIWGYYSGTTPLLQGLFVPRKVIPISCRRFGFRTSDGRLLFDVANSGYVDTNGVDLLAEFVPGKFIQHRPRVNGDVPIREGIGRALLWYALFRSWDIRDWLTAAEKGWKPSTIVKWMKSLGAVDDEDIVLAKLIAERLTTNASIAMPDTLDVKQDWPKNGSVGSQSQHREFAEWAGQEMSKGVLGHTQVVEVGTKGARSASEVGYSVSKDRKRPRALSLAATLHAQLTIPFVAFNRPGKHAPFLLPNLGEPINMAEFSKALKDLTGPQGAGMPVQVSWAREQLRIPNPDEGEEMMGGGAPVDPNAKPDSSPTPPDVPPPDDAPDDAEPDDEEPEEVSGEE